MSQPKTGVGITGLGSYIPQKTVTNKDLSRRLKIRSEAILSQTGIESRHYVSKNESASFMAAEASKAACKKAGLEPAALDLIIGCTTSGDYVFPATSAKVQSLLGAKKAGAFDLSASASSFPIALGIAADRLRARPETEHVLIFGTAVQSPYIDWRKENLAVLLGDAAAAAVVSRVPARVGILAGETLARGESFEAARLRGGGSSFPIREDNVNKGLQFIEMDGPAMGREFLKAQPELIEKTLEKAGVKKKDVDLIIFHQANLRLIHYAMDKLKMDKTKTFSNISHLGNTAEASIPLALCEAEERGILKKNSLVVLSGVGAGCILAVTVLRWK